MKNTIKIFSGECTFIAGAVNSKSIPELKLPEFAFVGRSNVGKSSLINALLNRKSLARVSQTPGCTKQLNFFELNGALTIVDLPGYGFARLSNNDRNSWNTLIHTYLRTRQQLLRVFLLIDSRHPIKELDKKTMTFLDEYAVSYQVIMTKVDKLGKFDQEEFIASVRKITDKHSACHPEIILTSSHEKNGIVSVQEEIINLMDLYMPSQI